MSRATTDLRADALARLLSPQFLLLLAAHGMLGMVNSLYFLFPTYLRAEFAADPTSIGIMSGAPWVIMFLSAPFTGSMVDRLGRRRFIFMGALVLAIACAMQASIHTIGPAMLAARMLHGLGFSFYLIGASTMAADLAPASRLSQALGLFGATMVITNALAPYIGESWAKAAGWSTVFWATSGAACIAALLTTLIGRARERPSGERVSFSSLLIKPSLRSIWVVSALIGVIFGAELTFSGPWAFDSGFQNVSSFFLAYALAATFVRVALGSLADRVGRLRVAIAAIAIYSLSPLALIDVASVGLFLPGIAFGIAHGLFYPALNTLALERSDERARGSAMALFNGFFNIGFTVGSIGLGPVVAAIGYPRMFAGSSVFGLWALVLVILMARRRPD